MNRLLWFVLLSSLAVVSSVGAQQAKPPAAKPAAPTGSAAIPAPPAPSGAMTNADVIKLVKAGVGESIILIAIREAKETAFDTSADGLVKLKAGGVSDAVLAAMISPRAVAAPPPVATPARRAEAPAASLPAEAGSAAGNEPLAALTSLDPGIYLDTEKGVGAMVPLEPASFSQGKTGGVFTSALTYGIKKAKLRAVVRNGRADIRTDRDRPTFYFKFEQRSAGPGGVGGWLGGATSPNEFVLAQMSEKKDSRELVVGEFGGMTGASTGARSQDTVPFKIERLAGGLYRVVPSEDLGPGEFCFFYGSAAGVGAAGKLFDFGVDETRRR